MGVSRRQFIIQVVLLVLLYVLLGNARSTQPNLMIPGATIAVNMIVPVLAGVLFGRYQGLLVGFFGTLINSFSPAGSYFEVLAIVPHSIMGFLAGYCKEKHYMVASVAALLVGHILNVTLFAIFGLMSAAILINIQFWLGILYETFVGILAIVIIASIFRLASPHGTDN